jgi:hypothetical protein
LIKSFGNAVNIVQFKNPLIPQKISYVQIKGSPLSNCLNQKRNQIWEGGGFVFLIILYFYFTSNTVSGDMIAISFRDGFAPKIA